MNSLRWPSLRRGRLLLAALAFLGAPVASQQEEVTNFQIFPGRLLFERGAGIRTITIINAEKASTLFEVSIGDFLMAPSGEIVSLASVAGKPELLKVASRVQSAKSFLLAAPRRMTLGPGEVRLLRVRAAPENFLSGEYRSHLIIRALPVGSAPDAAAGGVAMQLKIALQMTVPLIVRVGPRDARAALLHPHLMRIPAPSTRTESAASQALQVELARRGSSSIFGNVEVRSSSANRKDPPIGELKWIGVYPEIESRPVTIALKREPLHGERLQVTFWDQEKIARKPLAQIEYQVP